MEKTLNLIEILKDAPIGTKLYSPMFGELTFMGIDIKSKYPIIVMDKDGEYKNFNNEGKYFIEQHNIKLSLFPSKNNRNWSEFKPKFNINILQPFDKVLGRYNNNTNWTCDFYECYSEDSREFCCIVEIYEQCIPYNDETKHLIGTSKMPPEKYITWE